MSDKNYLPCGGRMYFDTASECAYRCDRCMAVVGSVGMPRECEKLYREQPMRTREEFEG
jgi:hypothetical protein